jgi:CAAX prenyl protease-like protein
VFVTWVLAARAIVPQSAMPKALAALPYLSREAWIIGHILVSVIIVPLAEELAFRGYLMRRIMAVDFESVSPGCTGWWALLISAAVFGTLHGVFWLPGVMAGIVFGLIYKRTGRLGEAVVAHATANALIAAAVLAGSQWQLW